MQIEKILQHYFLVEKKERLPNFLLAKRVKVDLSSNDLWREHDKAMKRLRNQEFSKKEEKENLLLLKKILAERMLEECIMCERKCKVNRKKKIGFCGVKEARIASIFAHYGEEEFLIPSGTVFFAGCNFQCVYCQNWDISQYPKNGVAMEEKRLAMMIEQMNVKNVNLVGGEPTPNLPFIFSFLLCLNKPLPIIWNSNMYMSPETMKLLDGVVDLYLADFKYGNDKCAEMLSKVKNYVKVVERNHKIASQQCSLLVRHLVLPNHVECCSFKVLEKLKGITCVVNIMSQYRPEYKASLYPNIARRITMEEYEKVVEKAEQLGIPHLTQEMWWI